MKTPKKHLIALLLMPLLLGGTAVFSQVKQLSMLATTPIASGTARFVKADSYSLTFEINLAQIPENGCYLKIVDQKGEILYEKKITTRDHRKTYRIERGELSKITFEAIGKNFRFQESFDLHFTTEEKIAVTRL